MRWWLQTECWHNPDERHQGYIAKGRVIISTGRRNRYSVHRHVHYFLPLHRCLLGRFRCGFVFRLRLVQRGEAEAIDPDKDRHDSDNSIEEGFQA